MSTGALRSGRAGRVPGRLGRVILRRVLLALSVLPIATVGVSFGGLVAAGARGGAVPATTTYRPPVAGLLVVLRGFGAPVTRYGAGHLGVDLRLAAGAAVLSAGAGRVRFAGSVAGRGVVVVQHPDGIATEYEPVRPSVRVGATVTAGQPVGVLTGRHRGCPGSCLHWGARRGAAYLDPLSLLRPLGPVRLLPWAGG